MYFNQVGGFQQGLAINLLGENKKKALSNLVVNKYLVYFVR